jgi:hypothetical protein
MFISDDELLLNIVKYPHPDSYDLCFITQLVCPIHDYTLVVVLQCNFLLYAGCEEKGSAWVSSCYCTLSNIFSTFSVGTAVTHSAGQGLNERCGLLYLLIKFSRDIINSETE